ncbi:hypothetical protein EV645_6618 [Kribbella rubisoli]|uniref:Uncharacterized protein n=1 Tax=Kribbella rubisoli TaxID=3075929 RepID=A0A4V2FWK3_9ACTN|nr:hypothetical protein EV645_6618 [Kribbella rubisoli]
MLAALIGAGAVAVTAISGFIASVRVARLATTNASNTLQLALTEQQRERVWERRAEVYVDVVEYVHRRLRARQSLHEPAVLTAVGGTGIVPPVDYGAAEWFAFDARLRVFAADSVLKEFSAALKADIAAREAIDRQDPGTAQAMRAAVEADAALHASIRAELAGLAGAPFGMP